MHKKSISNESFENDRTLALEKERKNIIRYVKNQIKDQESDIFKDLVMVENLKAVDTTEKTKQFKIVFKKALNQALDHFDYPQTSLPKVIDELYVCFLYSSYNSFEGFPRNNVMNNFKKILLNDPEFKKTIFEAIKNTPKLSASHVSQSVRDGLSTYLRKVGLYYNSSNKEKIFNSILNQIPSCLNSYNDHIIKKNFNGPTNFIELLDYLKDNNTGVYNDFKSHIHDIHRQRHSSVIQKKVQYAEEMKYLLNQTIPTVEFGIANTYQYIDNKLLSKFIRISLEKRAENLSSRTPRRTIAEINETYFSQNSVFSTPINTNITKTKKNKEPAVRFDF